MLTLYYIILYYTIVYYIKDEGGSCNEFNICKHSHHIHHFYLAIKSCTIMQLCNLKLNAVPKHICDCTKTKCQESCTFSHFSLNHCIDDLLTKYNAGAVAGRSRRTGRVTVVLHHPSWKYHSRLVVGQRLLVCYHSSSRYPVVLVLFNRGS